MSSNGFDFTKIETHCLKVHINCQGCLQRVRKLLRKVKGVYEVEIDAEEQKVTVKGSVDSTILINKLLKFGKHAELWSLSSKQDEVEANPRENLGTQMQDAANGFDIYKYQHMLPMFGRELNNGSGFEWYFNQGNSVSNGQFEFNPILMTNDVAIQDYSVDTSGLRGLQYDGFPDYALTQLRNENDQAFKTVISNYPSTEW